MNYGKKKGMPLPKLKPTMGDMNESMGSAGIMRPAPMAKPKSSPRRKVGHNTTLGKYAGN
jgi:hypothetical protein